MSYDDYIDAPRPHGSKRTRASWLKRGRESTPQSDEASSAAPTPETTQNPS